MQVCSNHLASSVGKEWDPALQEESVCDAQSVPDSEGDAFLWHAIGLLPDKEASPRHICICTSWPNTADRLYLPVESDSVLCFIKAQMAFPCGGQLRTPGEEKGARGERTTKQKPVFTRRAQY